MTIEFEENGKNKEAKLLFDQGMLFLDYKKAYDNHDSLFSDEADNRAVFRDSYVTRA